MELEKVSGSFKSVIHAPQRHAAPCVDSDDLQADDEIDYLGGLCGSVVPPPKKVHKASAAKASGK